MSIFKVIRIWAKVGHGSHLSDKNITIMRIKINILWTKN